MNDTYTPISGTLDFILNRLDNVALDVIKWMPEEDNLQHHHAVEHLLRVRQEVIRLGLLLDPDYKPHRMEEDLTLYGTLPEISADDAAAARRYVRAFAAKWREQK